MTLSLSMSGLRQHVLRYFRIGKSGVLGGGTGPRKGSDFGLLILFMVRIHDIREYKTVSIYLYMYKKSCSRVDANAAGVVVIGGVVAERAEDKKQGGKSKKGSEVAQELLIHKINSSFSHPFAWWFFKVFDG